MRVLKGIIPASLVVGFLFISAVTTESQSQLGQWAPVMDWGYQAKHMAALPNG